MRVLLSGGCKTETIINTIKSKFDSSGDDLFHVNYINNINEIYQKGNYFDKAIIVDQSITEDHKIDNENKLRERINRFAFECANRGRNEVYMFLTGNEELANIIHEETLAIRNKSIIIMKEAPYGVKFFANLIIADLSQIPEKLIFTPQIDDSFEDFDSYTQNIEDETYEEEESMLPAESFDNITGMSSVDGRIKDEFKVDDGQEFMDEQPYDEFGVEGTGYEFGGTEDFGNTEDFGDFGNTGDFDNMEGFEDFNNVGDFSDFGNTDDFGDFDNVGDFGDTSDFGEFGDFGSTDDFGGDFNSESDFGGEFDNTGNFGGDINNESDFENGFGDTADFGAEFDNTDNFGNTADFGGDFNHGSDFGSTFSEDDYTDNNNTNGFMIDSQGGFSDDNDSDYFGQFDNTTQSNETEMFSNDDYEPHSEVSGELPDYIDYSYVPPTDDNTSNNFTGINNEYIQDNQQFNYDNSDYSNNQQFEYDTSDYDDTSQQSYQFNDEQYGDYETENIHYNSSDVNGFNNPGSYMQAQEEDDYGMMGGAAALAVGGIAAGMAAGSMFNADDYETDNSHSIENYNREQVQQTEYTPGQFDADDYVQETPFNHLNYTQQQQQLMDQPPVQQVEQPPEKKGLFGRGRKQQNATQVQSFNNQAYQQPQQAQVQGQGNLAKLAKELATFAPRGNNICVTGCSGSGISTVSLNLANALANLGFQVLLVDLDTYGKSQSYFYKSAYCEQMFDVAHTRIAINSRGRLSENTVVLKEGLHLMSMGIGVDAEKPEKILEKTKVATFVNNIKREYNFIIYDTPFDLVSTTFRELATLCDNLVMVVETSTHGCVKTMLSLCNLPDDDLAATFFNKAQIVFNKERNMKKLFGIQVKTAQNMLEILDDKLQEITGEDYGVYFAEMNIAGIIKDNPDYELAWYEETQISDTPNGKIEYANLAYSIITRKRH